MYFCRMDRDETLEVKSRLCTMGTVPFRSHAENWCRYRRIDIAGRQKLLKVQWLLHLISVAREVGYFHIFLVLFSITTGTDIYIYTYPWYFCSFILNFFSRARSEMSNFSTTLWENALFFPLSLFSTILINSFNLSPITSNIINSIVLSCNKWS